MICQDIYICLLGLTVLLQITSFPTVWDLNMITPVFQMSCWTQSTIMTCGTLTKQQDCQFGSCPNSNLNNYNLLLLFLFSYQLQCGGDEHTAQFCSFTLCVETSAMSHAEGDYFSARKWESSKFPPFVKYSGVVWNEKQNLNIKSVS